MTDQFVDANKMVPITPPPELVGEWLCSEDYLSDVTTNSTMTITSSRLQNIATQAARWGADQELKACCEYLARCAAWEPEDVQEMLDLRRPKPPSLKELALIALEEAAYMADDAPPQGICSDQIDVIRRALEALPE